MSVWSSLHEIISARNVAHYQYRYDHHIPTTHYSTLTMKTFHPVSVCIQTGEVVRWVSNAEVLFGWCVDTWPFHLWSKLFGDLAPDMAGAEVDQQREAHQVLCTLCYTQWGGSRRNIFQSTSIQKIKKFVWERGVLVLCFCNELYSVYTDEVSVYYIIKRDLSQTLHSCDTDPTSFRVKLYHLTRLPL